MIEAKGFGEWINWRANMRSGEVNDAARAAMSVPPSGSGSTWDRKTWHSLVVHLEVLAADDNSFDVALFLYRQWAFNYLGQVRSANRPLP